MTNAEIVRMASLFAAGVAMGCGAIGAGVGEGIAAGETCRGISRQRSSASSIVRIMLIGQAITESPAIFALVVSMVLLFVTPASIAINKAGALIGAGICIGFGTIGSSTGQGLAASRACRAIARQPFKYGTFIKSMLIGQAVAETSAIFALVVALLLTFLAFPGSNLIGTVQLLAAGICMGAGAIGPGLGSGTVVRGGLTGIGRRAELAGVITRNMLLGQAVTESTSIYSLVIALLLIFVA